MKTNPVLIGIVNALFPGLGYLILRERLVLGGGMLIAMILYTIVTLTDPSPAFDMVLLAISPTGRVLEGFAYALAVLAFGYDAYDLARKRQLATQIPPAL